MKDSQKAPISAIFGVWLIVLVIIFGGAQCGCSGADVTELDAPLFDEPAPEPIEPELVDPLPLVEELPLPPAPRYFGGEVVAGYGLGSRAGAKAIPASRLVSWYAPADAPGRAELVAAIEELEALLPSWDFDKTAADEATLTFDLERGRDVAEACSLAYGEGTCWFGSAKCLTRSPLGTGLDDYYVCPTWRVHAHVDAIETYAAAHDGPGPRGTSLARVWRDFFIHEIGHTLGLRHADGSIMAGALPVYGEESTFSPCQTARLEGFRPNRYARKPLEVVTAEACQ